MSPLPRSSLPQHPLSLKALSEDIPFAAGRKGKPVRLEAYPAAVRILTCGERRNGADLRSDPSGECRLKARERPSHLSFSVQPNAHNRGVEQMRYSTSGNAFIILLRAGIAVAVLAVTPNGASAMPPGCVLLDTCHACPPRPASGSPTGVHQHKVCKHLTGCDDPKQDTSEVCGTCEDGNCS